MDKLASLWSFVRKHKYLITLELFAVIIGFLDENSVVRRLGYAREESRLRDESTARNTRRIPNGSMSLPSTPVPSNGLPVRSI